MNTFLVRHKLAVTLALALSVTTFAGFAAHRVSDMRRQGHSRAADRLDADRCVVYTYYADLGTGDGPLLEVWKKTWAGAGWKPRVLSEKHAAEHEMYEEYKAAVSAFPSSNGVAYETTCYLRHLAMAAVGGGWLTDIDTFNVNLPPPPACDWLPNNGALTTHDVFVPAIVSGTAEVGPGARARSFQRDRSIVRTPVHFETADRFLSDA